MAINASNGINRSFQIEIVAPEMILEPCIAYVEIPRPLRHRLAFVLKFYPAIIGSIVLLLDASGPAAIIRRVVAFAIDSIDAVFRRGASSHVGQEVTVRLQPSVADFDALRSIACEVIVGWAQASRLDTDPCAIFGRLPFSARSIFAEWCHNSPILLEVAS